ncbi:MAG: hypothetical protein R3F59_16060 [Myxococcota bacterium]
MEHDDDTGTPPPASSRGFGAAGGALVAAPLALGLGVLGGLVVGLIIGWVVKPSPDVAPPPEPTEEVVEAEAVEEPEDDDLTVAQTRVAELEREVANRERRVRELEEQMQARNERGKEFVAEMQRLKKELSEAQTQLQEAEVEKQQLLDDLRKTEAELVVTRDQRDKAREDALYNRWQDFLKAGQLEICDRGNRKKLGNCREAVDGALGKPAREQRFAHCIRSGQAAPMVRELDKDETLPAFAEMVDEDQKQTKGWMVIFCDPTLPEKADPALAESHLAK